MPNGFMYILECVDGSYYTGSTNNLGRRLWEHQNMLGANYTKKRLPIKLVYYEEYSRIDKAFYREKQVQGWSRKKKEALINGKPELLPKLAIAYRDLKDGGFEKLNDDATVASSESSVVSRTSTTDKVCEALPSTQVLPGSETFPGSEARTVSETLPISEAPPAPVSRVPTVSEALPISQVPTVSEALEETASLQKLEWW
jgi:putative endonuclease